MRAMVRVVATWAHGRKVAMWGRMALWWRLIELSKIVLYHERLHHAIYLRLLKTPTNTELSELIEASLTDRLLGCVCHR